MEFTKGGWRRGNFAPAATHIRHVVFDEADQLLSGGYLRPVRGAFDVLYREEKLAALGLTVPGSILDGGDFKSLERRRSAVEWAGDAARPKDGGDRAWSADHDDINAVAKRKGKSRMGKGGPALGGKGEIGVGEGRDFRRQYVFAAATVMSNGKKTPGAMIRHGFPDAKWIEGRRLHKAVATVDQTWVNVTASDARGRARPRARPRRRGETTRSHVGLCQLHQSVRGGDGGAHQAGPLRRRLPRRGGHPRAARRLDALANGDVTVLVCTDSAARGVDVPGVVHVIKPSSRQTRWTTFTGSVEPRGAARAGG